MNCRALLFAGFLASGIEIKAAEAQWHEREERDLNWCRMSATELTVKGTLFCGNESQLINMTVALEQIPEDDIEKALRGKVKLYGPSGGGNTKDIVDTVIMDITITVGPRILKIPPSALEGVLNPVIPSGVRIESAAGGYLTLTFLGSAGERAYTCCFIFKNWEFAMRQVTKDEGKTVETFPSTN
jgi:hypothetical protein